VSGETASNTSEEILKKDSAQTWSVAVIGNPNTGKTTLFNALTGLKQHVGNYPGVTVERKVGAWRLDDNCTIDLIDLPGTYSLAARSPDEMIAVDVLLGQQKGAPRIDAILAIADASNPERNFYLISQLLELKLPVVVALNMMDVAESKGIQLDAAKLATALGAPVVGICANKGKNIDALKAAVRNALATRQLPSGEPPRFPEAMLAEVSSLARELGAQSDKVGREVNQLEAFRTLVDKGGYAEKRLADKLGADFSQSLESRRQRASKIPLPAEEVRARYAWVKQAMSEALTRPAQRPATTSDTIDKYTTHWLSGTVIFAALMLVVFQSIFRWSAPLMDWINALFGYLGDKVASHMADGVLKSLLCDGVIAGVGGVLVFLPQICFLFLFIAVLEDCGYMARAAFLMDRLFSRVGLSGKSFIPMLSSFACAVPGVMATRTIENPRDRLTTILVAPLMSCSARLPVYIILIKAFIPETAYAGGWLTLQGLTLFAMYWVGIVVAVPVAFVLKKTLLRGETPPFLIELPSYKTPDWRTVLLRVFDRGRAFVVRAGTIILAVSIVVWALAYFPHNKKIAEKYEAQREELMESVSNDIDEDVEEFQGKKLKRSVEPLAKLLKQAARAEDEKDEKIKARGAKAGSDERARIEAEHLAELSALAKSNPELWEKAAAIRDLNGKLDEIEKRESGEFLRNSYFGKMGHAVEPVFKPLGWDWRISMAAMASFPAREVIVATLGTIFNLGRDQDEESEDLKTALNTATWDDSARKLFNIPVALSIMVFFALCSQCAATLATIRRETNTWRWPAFSFAYMTTLAYFGALLTYQLTTRLGWG
jgi:ferrous iron transport protein B